MKVSALGNKAIFSKNLKRYIEQSGKDRREQKFTVEACFEMVTPDGELDLVEESHLLHPDETEETL